MSLYSFIKLEVLIAKDPHKFIAVKPRSYGKAIGPERLDQIGSVKIFKCGNWIRKVECPIKTTRALWIGKLGLNLGEMVSSLSPLQLSFKVKRKRKSLRNLV